MVYRNSSGWDDSGAHVNVRLDQGDTYRHGGIEYAHDGWPINNARGESPPPRPRRATRAGNSDRPSQAAGRTRAGNTDRPSQPAARPRAETPPNERAAREFYERNPRPRYTEEDELREYHAARNARDRPNTSGNRGQQDRPSTLEDPRDSYRETNRRNSPPPASRTHRRDPSPGSYRYYLNDNDYHDLAHMYGYIGRVRDMFSGRELVQYREYDEYYYAGTRRSLIHGEEGRYGDRLRRENYIAGGLHYAAINPRRRQPFSSTSRDETYSTHREPFAEDEFDRRFGTRDHEGREPFAEDEFDRRFGTRDRVGWDEYDFDTRFPEDRLEDGRYDAGDPCPDPSAHNGRHGVCFARRRAGYPG